VTRQYPDHIDIVQLHAREASAAERLRSSRLLAADWSVTACAFYGTYVSSNRSGSIGVRKSLELYKRTQS
jgi:hypothetical protein